MSHLLMIESWVGGTARILPEAILAAGHRYTFVTRNPEHYKAGVTGVQEHPVLTHACRVLTLETNDTTGLIEQLQCHHAADGFDGALTICDYYLETVVHVAQALAIPHPFPASMAVERRKDRVRLALDKAGIANPLWTLVHTWESALAAAHTIGFPLVLKPTDLASSAHVRLVRDDDELLQAFTKLRAVERNFRGQPRETGILLEEYLQGEEYSVEICTVDRSTVVLGVTDKSLAGAPYFIEDGHMFPARLDRASLRELEEFGKRVVEAVGHDRGIAHIEVKRTPEGPRLIEINPRMAGNYIVELVRHVTGLDLILCTIDLALGKRPPLTVGMGTARSAAIKFLVPPRAGVLRSIAGVEALASHPRIVRWHMEPIAGAVIGEPIDNACYLGHVAVVDPDGPTARELAEDVVRKLELVYEV